MPELGWIRDWSQILMHTVMFWNRDQVNTSHFFQTLLASVKLMKWEVFDFPYLTTERALKHARKSMSLSHSPDEVHMLGSMNNTSGISQGFWGRAGPDALSPSQLKPSSPVPFSEEGGCYESDCGCVQRTRVQPPCLLQTHEVTLPSTHTLTHAECPLPMALREHPVTPCPGMLPRTDHPLGIASGP